jgi:hypothetical protein
MAGVPESPFRKRRASELRDPLRKMRLMLLRFSKLKATAIPL